MGKKNKTTGPGLGKTLIRDRFGKQNRASGDTFLHTSDLQDGYDWGRLNLQSVTEQNNLEDFLSTAELAGTEFTAEKMNIKVIQKDAYGGLPQGEELARILDLQRQHKDSIRIPRRPHWERNMSASEVDQNERAAFLEWRRSLALLQEVDGLVFTPYEKNLDFWRQLWRVIERSDIIIQIVDARNPLLLAHLSTKCSSDIIVQIVDARNPLLFYCPDLETYVGEVDPSKQCVLLINKADFLTQSQRDAWAEYCNTRGLRVAFWSAMEETKRQEEEEKLAAETDLPTDDLTNLAEHINQTSNADYSDSDDNVDDDDDDGGGGGGDSGGVSGASDNRINDINTDSETGVTAMDVDKTADDNVDDSGRTKCDKESGSVDTVCNKTCDKPSNEGMETDNPPTESAESGKKSVESEMSDSVNKSQPDKHREDVSSDGTTSTPSDRGSNTGHLYTGHELLEYFRSLNPNVGSGMTTVGMVGYPNVGKSSTINAILNMKKVPVSATPGRTKHFQTLYVESDLMLCDCPGLVFPSFVTTKADLVVSGILPIDQMRDHIPPTALVCSLIPRRHLEKTYGVLIVKPQEGQDPHRVPTAEEFLNAYGAMRGFMNARGMPDCPRSSRYVLKDYVNGKLLYCHPPPGVKPEEFNPFTDDLDPSQSEPRMYNVFPESSSIDREFFEKKFSTSHTRTARSGGKDDVSTTDKPWKKHNNKKKKEKIRRVYGYLDKH